MEWITYQAERDLKVQALKLTKDFFDEFSHMVFTVNGFYINVGKDTVKWSTKTDETVVASIGDYLVKPRSIREPYVMNSLSFENIFGKQTRTRLFAICPSCEGLTSMKELKFDDGLATLCKHCFKSTLSSPDGKITMISKEVEI